MTAPLDERGLEAARASFVMENNLERAIRDYLAVSQPMGGWDGSCGAVAAQRNR